MGNTQGLPFASIAAGSTSNSSLALPIQEFDLAAVLVRPQLSANPAWEFMMVCQIHALAQPSLDYQSAGSVFAMPTLVPPGTLKATRWRRWVPRVSQLRVHNSPSQLQAATFSGERTGACWCFRSFLDPD